MALPCDLAFDARKIPQFDKLKKKLSEMKCEILDKARYVACLLC